MKSRKGLILSVLLTIVSMVALYACGGETPPTPTVPPPTATAVPPSPTAVPKVEPTSTTAPSAVGGGTSSGGTTATSADLQSIMDAITATAKLNSYHYNLGINATELNQSGQVEGDFVAPNKGYVKGTVGGQAVEQLIVGDKIYVRGAGSSWVERPKPTTNSSDPTQLFSAANFTSSANPIEGMNSLLEAATDIKDAGSETVNGVNAKHYTFKLDMSKLGTDPTSAALFKDLPPIGGGEIWLDPSTKYVQKMSMSLDLGALMQALAAAMAGAFGGTPTPGGPTPTAMPSLKFDVNMSFSKQNDPSITVPDAPADTGGSSTSATDTPSAVEGSTPEATATTGSSGSTGGASASNGPTIDMGSTGEADGLKVTVNKVRRSEEGQIFKPKAGNEFLILELTFENTKTDTQPVSSLLQFSVVDGAGKEYNTAFTELITNLIDGDVTASGKKTGETAFEVPKTATGLVFVYKPLLSNNVVRVKLDR